MKIDENILKRVSFYVITILFLSLSFVKICSSISTDFKIIVLYEDFSSEEEISDSEENFSDEYLDLFFFQTKNLDEVNFFNYFPKTQSAFLIPKVFFDIQLLPPEA
jgi:hypothetical protein